MAFRPSLSLKRRSIREEFPEEVLAKCIHLAKDRTIDHYLEFVKAGGSGAFGQVDKMRVTDPFRELNDGVDLPEYVAVKRVIMSNYVHQAVKDFIQEIALLEAIQRRSTPHSLPIPTYYGCFVGEENVYVVSEWIEGKELFDLITMNKARDATLLAFIMKPLLCAVSDLHRHGIVHGDLTPANVMIEIHRNGTFGKLYLVDLGKSMSLLDCKKETPAFSLAYMDPVLIFKGTHSKEITPEDWLANDWWGAVLTLYSVLLRSHIYKKLKGLIKFAKMPEDTKLWKDEEFLDPASKSAFPLILALGKRAKEEKPDDLRHYIYHAKQILVQQLLAVKGSGALQTLHSILVLLTKGDEAQIERKLASSCSSFKEIKIQK